MVVVNKKTAGEPKISPGGEQIYELLGAPDLKSISFAKVVAEPGKGSPKHFHEKLTEIYYVEKGQMRLVVDDEEHILSPGDAIAILPGQRHQFFNEGEENLEFIVSTAPAWYAEDFHEAK